MLFLDSVLLILIIALLHILRIRYPNIFFFCKGAKLFLPPEWDGSQKKKQVQVKIIQIQYQHVKSFPMQPQYQRILFVIIALLIYLPLKAVIIQLTVVLGFEQILKQSTTSTFCFLISLVTFIYTLKIALNILWISPYRFGYCLAMSFGLNLFYFITRLTFQHLGIGESQLSDVTTDYKKHLQLVFGNQNAFLSEHGVLVCVFLFNSLLTLGFVPSIIKFGNWYTTTLKEIYYEEEEGQKQKKDKEKQQKQKQLKRKSKKTINYLNMYLFTFIAFIFISHPHFLSFLSPITIDIVRLCLICFDIFVIAYTLAPAVEFNGSYAYQYVCNFFTAKQKTEKEQMLKKIAPYIRQIWYTKFQYMFRVFFTAFICIMLIDWKYLHGSVSPLQKQPVVSETHCGIISNEILLLQNIYKCDAEQPKFKLHQFSEYNINGAQINKQSSDSEMSKIQQNVRKHGLLNSDFLVIVFEELLWYHSVTLFAATIVYILFLRKAVYEI